MNDIYSVYEVVHVQNDRESPYISTYLAKSYFIGMKRERRRRLLSRKGTIETIRKGKKINHRLRKSHSEEGINPWPPSPSHSIENRCPLRGGDVGAHVLIHSLVRATFEFTYI